MRGGVPPILSQLMSVLPLTPLELVSRQLIASAFAARPAMASRLADYAATTFAIDPVDCPFAFLISPGRRRPCVRLVRNLEGVAYDARIAAPLLMLLGLLDGSYDGDALFFSRDLLIEGDTEAVLALRNAIENAELDPASIVGLPQPLCAPFNRAANIVRDGVRRALDAPDPASPATERIVE